MNSWENIQIKVYHTDGSEEMKEIQLKSMRKVQEKIKKCEPTNSKDIVWNTFGRNNWRKMHGFPLMSGEVEKIGKKNPQTISGIGDRENEYCESN